MNIYVGNLSRDLNEGELREAFAAFGDVASASIIKDKFSGETRGFGFVEMPNKEEADKAIAALNGKDLKGRTPDGQRSPSAHGQAEDRRRFRRRPGRKPQRRFRRRRRQAVLSLA